MGNSLITEELFERVLIDPAIGGATELHIVSGYASPAMVTKHFEELRNRSLPPVQIDVLVGMTGSDGLPRNSLLGFQSIPRQSLGNGFNCSFTLEPKSIHSKLYVWSTQDGPIRAFAGSANYTQRGFGLGANSDQHHEVCVEVDPMLAFDYVLSLAVGSIGYKNPEISKYLRLTDSLPPSSHLEEVVEGSHASIAEEWILPLVQTRKEKGEVHKAAGINWGQRVGRNPDQAYIPVPKTVSTSGFFPTRGQHFQIVTDDGESFMATVAQDGEKAIEIPKDNALLGLYFRNRLGLPSGAFVSTEDLMNYGSNGVKFTRVSSDLYLLDFSKGIKATL